VTRFIDKNGKLFGKVSVIDVLLIVLIIGLAAGFGYKRLSAPAERIVNANTKFYATFEVEKVREFSVAAFSGGDILYEQYGQQPLGKVVAIRVEEARDVLKRADGTAILAPMEEKYNVYITVEASGSVNEGGYYFNGNQQLAVGSDLTLQSNMALCSARVFWLGMETGEAD